MNLFVLFVVFVVIFNFFYKLVLMCFPKKIRNIQKIHSIQKIKKHGCEICNYPVIFLKKKCQHKYCEYCVNHLIIHKNNCPMCEIVINSINLSS
jgi:hypothetical protein